MSSKHRRLSLKERIKIETLLNEKKSKAYIAKILHELAHIICDHKVKSVEGVKLPSYMRYYDKFQESEAEYLGACLQLPR